MHTYVLVQMSMCMCVVVLGWVFALFFLGGGLSGRGEGANTAEHLLKDSFQTSSPKRFFFLTYHFMLSCG